MGGELFLFCARWKSLTSAKLCFWFFVYYSLLREMGVWGILIFVVKCEADTELMVGLSRFVSSFARHFFVCPVFFLAYGACC